MLQPLTLKVSGRAVRPLVVPQYPLVMVITGGYQVDLGPSGSRRAPRFHLVLKDRTCNCGAMDCQGLRAVENYLKAGGLRAPDGIALKSLTVPCPICHARRVRWMAAGSVWRITPTTSNTASPACGRRGKSG
jgi:hypothetical protein